MTAPAGSARGLAAVAGLVAVATCAAVVFAPGNIAAAAAPVLVASLVWMVWRARLRTTVIVLMLLVMGLDDPLAKPYDQLWQSPLQPLGALVFVNLRHLGLDLLRFSTIDLAIVGLPCLLLYRRLVGDRRDGTGPLPAAGVIVPAALAALGAVLFVEAWGVARGGNFQMSLWQARQPVLLPIATLLLLAVLRGPRDLRAIALVILSAASLKALIGFVFYFGVALPQGLKPAYMTTHGDSVLFVMATVIVLALFLERRSAGTWLLMGSVVPTMLLAIVLNNRRLAYVELAACLMAIYFLAPASRLKRRLKRAALVAAPLVALYVAAGWNSTSGVFSPVHALRSVATSSDDSSNWRDRENENLLATLRANPVLGSGFGHPYLQAVEQADISQDFSEYLYLPHNSLLGFIVFGGLPAFIAFWLPLIIGVYLAARGYRRARTPRDRTAALACISAVLVYLIQAWGDGGLQGWDGTWIVAAAVAASARLAVAVGAWPAPAPARRPVPTAPAPASPSEVPT